MVIRTPGGILHTKSEAPLSPRLHGLSPQGQMEGLPTSTRPSHVGKYLENSRFPPADGVFTHHCVTDGRVLTRT